MPYLKRDMLGLKKGDEVKVGGLYENRQFSDGYITKEEFTAVDIALMLEVGLLTEEKPTEKIETPWEPKLGDVFYTLDFHSFYGVETRKFIWGNSSEEFDRLNCGLIFPTESAALAKAEEIKRVLKK